MVTSRLSDFREFLERNIRSEIRETGDLLTGQQWTPFWGSVENTFDTFKETFVGGNKPLYHTSQVRGKSHGVQASGIFLLRNMYVQIC